MRLCNKSIFICCCFFHDDAKDSIIVVIATSITNVNDLLKHLLQLLQVSSLKSHCCFVRQLLLQLPEYSYQGIPNLPVEMREIIYTFLQKIMVYAHFFHPPSFPSLKFLSCLVM